MKSQSWTKTRKEKKRTHFDLYKYQKGIFILTSVTSTAGIREFNEKEIMRLIIADILVREWFLQCYYDGHDNGILLMTNDGSSTWTSQFDGRHGDRCALRKCHEASDDFHPVYWWYWHVILLMW